MFTESKVIELFCMADNFCKFFDAMMAKYGGSPDKDPLKYIIASL